MQPALLAADLIHERAYFVGYEMIDLDGNAKAAGLLDQFSGFLNRFRPIHLRPLGTRRPPGNVDACACFAKLNRDTATGSSSRARYQGYFPCQWFVHTGAP